MTSTPDTTTAGDSAAMPGLPSFWAETARRERLTALAAYDLTDPRLREQLDGLAADAAAATGHPMSVISAILMDVQMIIGDYGVAGWPAATGGLPAEWSFCLHVVLDRKPFVVPDAHLEPRVASSPLALSGALTSYTGVPITDVASGETLGALCVVDHTPGSCGEHDLPTLTAIADQAATLISTYRRAV